ncbi:SDR family NAD(P)-dependent oxidoreductase [Nesterenkonia sandarakina]|uniref:NAD(P)-dependent dehydrogenase (Short-subunit alcohol dehydrogenase family) n=1 Tax=Nesterenkonia sandarakina TaxID=272918 RepID=A0A7Z0J2T2_9MICC|nr:SDR family NAD(P)-dependent oxidoreductase [Nesterenkonia sandarakina]NYJ16189.1 NAD(P)-dependent dehydrogenase (short-subunit alcohol dehydrogenase family) [Nesterenkonia sandarakina]
MLEKTIILTGASDGIGAAAARQLVADGHTVALVGRSKQKTEALAQELDADFFLADFTRFSEVRTLAARLKDEYPRIDVLVNNAGGIFGDQTRTEDGFEKTLQVNHLAPFLLTNLLMNTLTASNASIINTASVGARFFGKIDLDNLNNERRYSANKAYGDAKLANILFAKELHRRFSHQGISAVAFHPGNVMTSFASDTTSVLRFIYQTPLGRMTGLISPEQGALPLVWLAEGESGREWVSGEYYEKQKIAKTNPQAADAQLAAGLWDKSAEFVGLSTPAQ